MSRYRWPLVLIVGLAVVAMVVTGVLIARPTAVTASTAAAPDQAPDAQGAAGAWRWSYAAKFVCGLQLPLASASGQPPLGEPVVKPGNYATDINIHNYNYKTIPLRKKLLVLVETDPSGQQQRAVREPETTEPRAFAQVTLGPDFATMDDCFALWRMLYPGTVPPTPMPLMVGYLVIISPLDLDVDVVYTAAAPSGPTERSNSVSIDVERVTGKRVFVPSDQP